MAEWEQIYNDTTNQTLYDYDETRRLIDPDTTDGLKQVRQAMIDSYTPNKLLAQQSFHGVCLRQLDTVIVEDGEGVGQARLRIKARIPEIHSFLPIPTGPEDYMTLAFYPTFVSPAGSVDAGTIAPGSPVKLSFGNMANFADPTFEGVYNLGGGGGGTGQPGSRRTHANNRRADDYPNKPGGPIIQAAPVTDNLASWIAKEPNFNSRARRKNVINTIVIHQSCTTTVKKMVNTLRTRTCGGECPSGLGTHFSVDHKGKVVQYTNLDQIATHAGNVNPRSIGIDMVTQCTFLWREKDGKNRGWRTDLINDPKRQYISPYPFGGRGAPSNTNKPKQIVVANGIAMSRVYDLVSILIKKVPTLEAIFPAASGGAYKVGFVGRNATGIVAHANVASKGDGYATTFYLWLRLKKGYDHTKAYKTVLDSFWAQSKYYASTEQKKTGSRTIKV